MAEMWYFTRDNRQSQGPFTFEELRELASCGALLPTDMVRGEGGRGWSPAGEVPGLFPAPSAGSDGFGWVEVAEAPAEADLSPPPQARRTADGELPPAPESLCPEDTERARNRAVLVVLLTALGLTAAGAMMTVVLSRPAVREAVLTSLVSGATATLVVGLVAGAVCVVTGLRSSCPRCSRWWARSDRGTRVVGRKECYGLVTRTAHTSSGGCHSGSIDMGVGNPRRHYGGSDSGWGTTTWKERVPVIRTTYRTAYRCKHCQADWFRETVRQVEDFDRG